MADRRAGMYRPNKVPCSSCSKPIEVAFLSSEDPERPRPRRCEICARKGRANRPDRSARVFIGGNTGPKLASVSVNNSGLVASPADKIPWPGKRPGGPRKVFDEEKAIALRAEGLNWAQVGAAVGVCAQTVCKRLGDRDPQRKAGFRFDKKEASVPDDKPKRWSTRKVEIDTDRAYKLRSKGMSWLEISEELGAKPSTVRRKLEAAHPEIKRKPRAKKRAAKKKDVPSEDKGAPPPIAKSAEKLAEAEAPEPPPDRVLVYALLLEVEVAILRGQHHGGLEALRKAIEKVRPQM